MTEIIGMGNGVSDYDEAVAVVRNDDGSVVLLPASITKLEEEPRELLAELMATALKITELDGYLYELVRDLRSYGVSWSAIGFTVGTTGEAARQRWAQRLIDDGWAD